MNKTVALALSVGLMASMMMPAIAATPTKSTKTTTHREEATALTTQSVKQGQYTIPSFRLSTRLEGEDQYSILRPCFSPDGRYIAANLNETKMVRVWDSQTGKTIADIKPELLFGNTQLADGIEFSKDGQRLIVMRAGYPLKEINWRNQEVVRTIEIGITGPKIEDYAFTPDYKWLVMGTPNGVQLIDYTKGERVNTYLSSDYINSVDISSDGRWVAFGKRGKVEESVGLIDLKTQKFERYPLAQLTTEQIKEVPNYQVRHVSFDGPSNLLVGYMALPEGQFKPTGPAGVFRYNIKDNRITGPEALSSNMLSFDPVTLGRPFNTTFFNTFDLSSMSNPVSAADFMTPGLQKIKTIGNAQFQGSMMTYRVSPDQRWMAGSFRDTDGKVRMRLYQIAPDNAGNVTNTPGTTH